MSVVVVACALLLFPATALARYPDDNGHHYGQLSNPGHHYCQLKHHQGPAPAPLPNPKPAPKPHPLAGGTAANHPAVASEVGQSASETSGIPDLPATLPTGSFGASQIGFGDTPGGKNQDWLLLVILP